MNIQFKIGQKLSALLLLISASLSVWAQVPADGTRRQPARVAEREGLYADDDTLYVGQARQLESSALPQMKQAKDAAPLTADSTKKHGRRDWATWRPEPKRALWLALVLPGAGQIYNRKYWKLPIIYGGFVGCAYAMRWNNMMYRDYSQAYLDIMDSDPNTQSYNQFLHLGSQITDENVSRWQDIFRRRKDRYRRWRDLSFFCMLGVYALSVVDAYVDASLSEFDISPDLSLHVAPTVINGGGNRMNLSQTGVGLRCSLTF